MRRHNDKLNVVTRAGLHLRCTCVFLRPVLTGLLVTLIAILLWLGPATLLATLLRGGVELSDEAELMLVRPTSPVDPMSPASIPEYLRYRTP